MGRWVCLYRSKRRLGGSIPILAYLSVLVTERAGDVHEEMGSTVRGDTPELVGDYISVWAHEMIERSGDSRCSVKTLTPALERL
jgi:hypothetical protein